MEELDEEIEALLADVDSESLNEDGSDCLDNLDSLFEDDSLLSLCDDENVQLEESISVKQEQTDNNKKTAVEQDPTIKDTPTKLAPLGTRYPPTATTDTIKARQDPISPTVTMRDFDFSDDCKERPSKIIKLSSTGRFDHVKPLRVNQRVIGPNRVKTPWATDRTEPYVGNFEAPSIIPPVVRRPNPLKTSSKFINFKHQPRSELRVLPVFCKTTDTNKRSNCGAGNITGNVDGSIRNNCSFGSNTNNGDNLGSSIISNNESFDGNISNGSSFGSNISGGRFGGRSNGGSFGSNISGGRFGGRSNGGSFGSNISGGRFGGRSYGGSFGSNISGGRFGGRSYGGSFGGNISERGGNIGSNLFGKRTVNFSTSRSSFGYCSPKINAPSSRFNLNHLK